ncbi:hypothetical protein E4U45_003497 [Claviceps purpurea]|nr:hypothetical protein E4U45_003497 [Claviceps purpurea]
MDTPPSNLCTGCEREKRDNRRRRRQDLEPTAPPHTGQENQDNDGPPPPKRARLERPRRREHATRKISTSTQNMQNNLRMMLESLRHGVRTTASPVRGRRPVGRVR